MAVDLDIAWSLDEPPATPAGWRRWDTVPPPAPDDAALEARLGWPDGTLAVLRQAFAAKLRRRTGWESPAPAVAAAARVFKRGVAYRSRVPFIPFSHSGQYLVRVLPTCELPKAGFTVVDV